MDRPNNNGFPDDVVMGEVDYSNLPYIISLFVLILSLCESTVLTSEVMFEIKNSISIIISVILFLWMKTKTARTDILLVGPSDSGKTYLFSQLLFSEDKETLTSIAANTGIYNGEHVNLFIKIRRKKNHRFIDRVHLGSNQVCRHSGK